MADDITQIKNPSLLAGDLAIKLSGDAITAISGHPLIGTGGGTQSDWIYVPSFDTETGKVLYELGTTADNPQPEGGWYISGAQGPQGETGPAGAEGSDGTSIYLESVIDAENGKQVTLGWGNGETSAFVIPSGEKGEQGEIGETGPQGASGYTPLMRINSTTNYWEVSYDEGATYTSLDVSATGPQGETGAQGEQGIQGEQGASGVSGYTPRLQINSETNYWEVSYDDGSTWSSLSVSATGSQGQSGASGTSGFSPTVSTKSISNNTKTGTEITFTTINGETSYSAWNGIDGTGSTYSIQGNNGISAELDESTSTYNIGISAHYISTVTTDNDTISGDGVTNPIGINNTYVTEWNEVTAKQNKADMSAYPTFAGMTTDSDYYCWSGTSGEGGHWAPISDKFYSKTEAAATFLKTNNVVSGDHTGVSGTGSDFKFVYIPMDIVTATPTVDDGILHVILDS